MFNDPIWGSIRLRPVEIVILDSPILQRLRRIRQLGVAHWVYPGATHSRLEHSIGVLHQVDKMILSINLQSPGEPINKNLAALLRITGLCHDIGHGVMSHVSENALKNMEEYELLSLAFADLRDFESRQLSEMAAFYMIGSSAFRELIGLAQEVSADHDLPENPVELMQNAIIGDPISDQIPLLHELISGPFDADKLDYMTRDAFMTGVPVVTDIPRLIQKIRTVQVPEIELPENFAANVKGGLASYTIIGIDLSGGRTLDELMLGRTLLFDKIYRHQKVRAVEVMVSSILLELSELYPESRAMVPYLFTDEELLDIDESKVSSLIGRPLCQSEKDRVAVAEDLAKRIKERRLFVRCFAYAQNMPGDPYKTEQGHNQGLERLQRETSDLISRRVFATRIAESLKDVLHLLGKDEILDSFQGQNLEPYLVISPPEAPTQAGDISHAYLISGDRTIWPFEHDAAETKGWADAYLLTRDIGYIFAPEEISPYVFVAAEKLVREEFEIRIPSAMMDYAKQENQTVVEIKRQLVEAGYYKSSPHELRPMPARLQRAGVTNTLRNVTDHLVRWTPSLRQPEG